MGRKESAEKNDVQERGRNAAGVEESPPWRAFRGFPCIVVHKRNDRVGSTIWIEPRLVEPGRVKSIWFGKRSSRGKS